MHVPAHLLPDTQLLAALTERFTNFPALLPLLVVDEALAGNLPDAMTWVRQRLSGDMKPAAELTVAVSKPGHGVRPVAVWDLPTTIAYRTLSTRLAASLNLSPRRGAEWEEFQRAPLASADKYIVSADISAYYQYIDHSLLAQELLVRTGEGEAVSALMGLLYEASGKNYGLPQQSSASDVLAEVFMQRLQRALVRRGLTLWRYNDDFRISCPSWPEVIRAIEVLADEARGLGLVLNDSKLLTWTRDRYSDYLEESATLLEEIALEAEIDLSSYLIGPYDEEFDSDDLDETEVQVLTGVRVLEMWQNIAGDGRVSDDNRSRYAAVMRLMPTVFRRLSAATEHDPVDAIAISMQLLHFEQPLTPRICNFLAGRTDHELVLTAFDVILRDGAYLNDWQVMWIVNSIGRWPEFDDGGAGIRRSWLDRFTGENANSLTRGFALMTSARAGSTNVAALMKVYDRINPIVQPLIVSAIGSCQPGPDVTDALVSESLLNKLAFNAS